LHIHQSTLKNFEQRTGIFLLGQMDFSLEPVPEFQNQTLRLIEFKRQILLTPSIQVLQAIILLFTLANTVPLIIAELGLQSRNFSENN